MIWLLLLPALLPTLAALLLYFLLLKPRFGFWKGDGWKMANVAMAVVLTIAWMVPAIRTIDHNRGNANCYSYGRQVGREVKYIDVSFWDYDCYVKTERGWITRSNITEVELR